MKNLLLAAGLFSMLTVSAVAEPLLLTSNFDPAAGPNEYVVTFPPEFGSSQVFMPIVGGSQLEALLQRTANSLPPLAEFSRKGAGGCGISLIGV